LSPDLAQSANDTSASSALGGLDLWRSMASAA
jgi:hypothetical protein